MATKGCHHHQLIDMRLGLMCNYVLLLRQCWWCWCADQRVAALHNQPPPVPRETLVPAPGWAESAIITAQHGTGQGRPAPAPAWCLRAWHRQYIFICTSHTSTDTRLDTRGHLG